MVRLLAALCGQPHRSLVSSAHTEAGGDGIEDGYGFTQAELAHRLQVGKARSAEIKKVKFHARVKTENPCFFRVEILHAVKAVLSEA